MKSNMGAYTPMMQVFNHILCFGYGRFIVYLWWVPTFNFRM